MRDVAMEWVLVFARPHLLLKQNESITTIATRYGSFQGSSIFTFTLVNPLRKPWRGLFEMVLN